MASCTGIAALFGSLLLSRVAFAQTDVHACPADTYWDGIACSHARVTCGGWNGFSCDSDSDHPAIATPTASTEYSAIMKRAAALCSDDDATAKRYTGLLSAIESAASADIVKARAISSDFQRLGARLVAYPTWTVATFVATGELYDCLWRHMREAKVQVYHRSFVQPANMHNTVQPPPTPGPVPPGFDESQSIARLWRRDCDYFFRDIEPRLVLNYVYAFLLSRRYSLNGYDLTVAHDRLPKVAEALGPARMTELVDAMYDPTDPETSEDKRRHLKYNPLTFLH